PRRAHQDRRLRPRRAGARALRAGDARVPARGDAVELRPARRLGARRVGVGAGAAGARAAGRGGVVSAAAAATAMGQGIQSCETCGLLSRPPAGGHEGRCPRCGDALEFRKADSIQRTWAFLIAAAVCYVPANLLPVLTTHTAAGAESDTIMQGVVLL